MKLLPMPKYAISSIICVFILTVGNAYAEKLPGKNVTVRPMKADPEISWFQHLIVAKGLQKLGYDVRDHLIADFPAVYMTVSSGDASYTFNHWSPLHDEFFEKAGGRDRMTFVKAAIKGAGQGYYVDRKTARAHDITGIEQMKDPEIAALFDTDEDGKANLSGCNPGWGCERVIEHQLDAFDLRGSVNHDQGSYFAIMADTIARYKQGEPVFYYTYSPNWINYILVPGEDVVQISVPFSALPDDSDADTEQSDGFNPGFAVNDVYIVGNNEFLKDNPAARKFFEMVSIPVSAVNEQNMKMHQGEDSIDDFRRHAEQWISANQEEFNSWIDAARAAAD